MKKIALVGSTGSIGRQVIDIVRKNPDKFKITAIIANSSAEAFYGQICNLTPDYAALCDFEAAERITDIPPHTVFLTGEDGAMTAFENCDADIAFVASAGFSGLKYSLKALERGMTLALANKETLVCGGDIIPWDKGTIIPVDSEHSAIWQCLNFDRNAAFDSLVITASGGPFRGIPYKELSSVGAEQALNHPTWKMGPKITIDSATLLNKGYEVIEAHHLYSVPYSKIHTVIHPQSIVHSMVRFCDGATLAQLSYPTMEVPIKLALTYPERIAGDLRQLDFDEALTLQFLPLERKFYPMYDLALICAEAGGIIPTVLNAASETAVEAFLAGRIKYTDIFTVTARTVESWGCRSADSYEVLEGADMFARMKACKVLHDMGK